MKEILCIKRKPYSVREDSVILESIQWASVEVYTLICSKCAFNTLLIESKVFLLAGERAKQAAFQHGYQLHSMHLLDLNYISRTTET